MREPATIHATAVAWDGRAVLIKGASGRGKSALGLMLMGLGCRLVADDRVFLRHQEAGVMVCCPDPIRGMIEARGVGLLKADNLDAAALSLVVDLDETERERLPKRRVVTVLGTEIPLIHWCDGPHFAPAILQILKAGWSDQ